MPRWIPSRGIYRFLMWSRFLNIYTRQQEVEYSAVVVVNVDKRT